MPMCDFFTRFGIFALRNFFDQQTCERLRSEVSAATTVRATVVDQEREVVDESVRRTARAQISPETVATIESRLKLLKPSLERHFDMTLPSFEEPQCLVYKENCFFRPHRDNGADPDYPAYIKNRQVSLVAFLNGEMPAPQKASYCGGALTFYGLVDNPAWEKYGFSLTGEAGLLIAFRSDIMHEITPITWGERYTVVSWLWSTPPTN
jgi:SM-20-related protein